MSKSNNVPPNNSNESFGETNNKLLANTTDIMVSIDSNINKMRTEIIDFVQIAYEIISKIKREQMVGFSAREKYDTRLTALFIKLAELLEERIKNPVGKQVYLLNPVTSTEKTQQLDISFKISPKKWVEGYKLCEIDNFSVNKDLKIISIGTTVYKFIYISDLKEPSSQSIIPKFNHETVIEKINEQIDLFNTIIGALVKNKVSIDYGKQFLADLKQRFKLLG